MRLPMLALAPARLPVSIPKAVEVPWYDRGWEDVLENAAQGLQDVGGWIADHPGEIGAAIILVVVAAKFFGVPLFTSISKGSGALAGMAMLPSIDTERVERELERMLEKDIKDTEDEEETE